MSEDQIKEISNSITAIRSLIAKEEYDKADEVAWDLQKELLKYVMGKK